MKYKVGNLIEAAKSGEVGVIAHCANCFCTMGSGIAPQIKKAFPYAFEADMQTQKGDYKKLGTYSKGVPIETGLPVVYNLYGQFGYGNRKTCQRDLNYNALYDSLLAMSQDLSYNTVVGLPKLGSGLAGGDWDILSLMIEKTVAAVCLDVIIYVLNAQEIPPDSPIVDSKNYILC